MWAARGGGAGAQTCTTNGRQVGGTRRRRGAPTAKATRRQACGQHAEAEPGHKRQRGHHHNGRQLVGSGGGASAKGKAKNSTQVARRTGGSRGGAGRYNNRANNNGRCGSSTWRWHRQAPRGAPAAGGGGAARHNGTASNNGSRPQHAEVWSTGTEAIESQIICENRFCQPKDIKYEDMQLSAFKVCIEPD